MQDSGVPTKIGTVWANSAASPYINTIPVASSPTNGRASFTDGFPPACFIPVASGGAGPFGGDMNGILQLVTQWLQWVQAGAPESYDGTFQTEIGGYPQNAIIASASTDGLWWLSTANNNVTDPDTGGAGWIGLPLSSWPNLVGSYAVDTGTANAGVVTLSPAPAAYTSLTGAPLRIRKVALANTGNYTINVNSLGAQSLLYPDGEQVPVLGLPASGIFTCVYDGLKFQLQSVTVPQRIVLSVPLNVYVATTGSDSTGDGSSGNPWATLQYAYDYIQSHFDLSGQAVTINVATGTYAGVNVAIPTVGGNVTFLGNTTTPDNVLISATSSNCFQVGLAAVAGCQINVEGFKLIATGSGDQGHGIAIGAGGVVGFKNIDFGACSVAHIWCGANALAFALGAYTISGGAQNHWLVTNAGSEIQVGDSSTGAFVITLTGSPAFSGAFAQAYQCGVITIPTTTTYSGVATGHSYAASLNGVIDTGGALNVPGDGTSTTGTTGGQVA